MTVHLVPRTNVYKCDICGRQLRSVEHVCVSGRGVGTELKSILSLAGMRQRKGCGCQAVQRFLDRKSIAWCEDNMPMILDKLESQAKKLDVRFSRFVASLAVRLAIRRAKRNARKKDRTNGHSI